MFKEDYKHMNEKIVPDAALQEAVMKKITPRRKIAFRPAVAIAAVMVLVLAATPVMAECIPWILERIAPELVEELNPVQRSDTNNGITMEVVAASVKGNMAELVVKIEGEVLVEPVGAAPFLGAGTTIPTRTTIHSLLDYEGVDSDHANGIYYYQVEMAYPYGTTVEEILGGEMTVTLGNVMISGFASEEIEVPVILTDDEQVTVTNISALEEYGFSGFGWGARDGYEYDGDMGEYVMLPSGENVYDVTDKLALSGAAYIDGKLHVQMAAVNMNGGNPEWGYRIPYFVDSRGNQVTCLYRNSFTMDDSTDRIDYEECVYDIPQEDLENYTMMIELEYYNMIPAGCEVTFRFNEDEVVTE